MITSKEMNDPSTDDGILKDLHAYSRNLSGLAAEIEEKEAQDSSGTGNQEGFQRESRTIAQATTTNNAMPPRHQAASV
jgi:hypothetical protein